MFPLGPGALNDGWDLIVPPRDNESLARSCPARLALLMSVYGTQRESILGRRPCRIYKFDQTERKVCPCRLGKSSENDLNVLYYQYEGYSSRRITTRGIEWELAL